MFTWFHDLKTEKLKSWASELLSYKVLNCSNMSAGEKTPLTKEQGISIIRHLN